MTIHRIAVLITSFNRREMTLACLAALFRQRDVEPLHLTVFLVDDGSADSTGDAVRTRFPQARVLQGSGGLFWNGGMRMAFDAAMKEGFDAYILLNDDTTLYDDALERVVACANASIITGKPAIVVGSTRSPGAGEHTYGGLVRRTRGWRLWLEAVIPDPDRAVLCETMNGNFTLIPVEVARTVGNLELRFRHQFGDLDYGFRAKSACFDLVVAPGYVGECPINAREATWRDPGSSFAARWRNLLSPKGVPVTEWLLFTRRHYGWRWLHYAASPYLKTIGESLFSSNSMQSVWDRVRVIK